MPLSCLLGPWNKSRGAHTLLYEDLFLLKIGWYAGQERILAAYNWGSGLDTFP